MKNKANATAKSSVVQAFRNEDFGEVRVMEIVEQREVLGKELKIYGSVDEPLFLAKDIAEWIDYAKTGDGSYDVSTMLKTVDADEKLLRTIFVAGRNRELWFLTEDGLYEVLMQSRKPIAKQFKKEVKVILRSIRKRGGYISENASLDQIVTLCSDAVVAKLSPEIESKLNTFSQWVAPQLKRIDQAASAAKYFASWDSFSKHESRWVLRMKPNLKLIMDKTGLNNLEVLRLLYRDMESVYDINLNDYSADWRLINGKSGGSSTLAMISNTRELKGYFESVLNRAMDVLELSREEHQEKNFGV